MVTLFVAPTQNANWPAMLVVKFHLRQAISWFPDAYQAVAWTASEQLTGRIPRNLLDLVFVTTPDLFGTVRLVDAPQINVFANSSHSHTAVILPLNF